MKFMQKRQLKSLQKKIEKAHLLREQEPNDINTYNEITLQYQLAEFYKKHRYDKDVPYADILYLECYRKCASIGDAKAQYLCGEGLLNKGKFWDSLSRHPIYGAGIHKKYAQAYFEEAFAYLRAAESADYVFAKRLLGLAHIHGWGIPKDINVGYKLILDSIQLENAWDRATKIFEELKLNSPEFFAALQSYRR